MDEDKKKTKKKDVVIVTVKEEEDEEEDHGDEEERLVDDEEDALPTTTDSVSASSDDNPDNPCSSDALTSSLPPSSSRLMRNLAEKMRRDKLNMYISELSSLVPIVAMATKRMDKTSVLRLSANFLRIHLSLKQSKKEKPKQATLEGLDEANIQRNSSLALSSSLVEANLSTALLETIEGFMLIVTSLGKIVYISESVEKLLGHSQLDLMGQSLYTICHNGDHELLRHHLQPSSPLESNERDGNASETADYVPRSPSFFGGRPEDTLTGLASGERRSFYVRLAERSMARGDPARHVTVHLIGYLRPPNNKKDAAKTAKGKKECSSTTSSGDEYLLVCVARPFRNKGITELSLMEAVQDEYVTRHLPDGKIIYSDHRIAFVAGYLTEEVMGLSAFNFIHQDDLPWATVANRQMFSSVEGQGYSVYRLRSKTGALIYLRTRGFLEFNKTTQKVETFVCINTLLTSEEGDKELEKERERITPFITFQQVTTTNMSSASTSKALMPSSSPSSSLGNALVSSAEGNVPITTKMITSLTMRHRKEKPLTTTINSPAPSVTATVTRFAFENELEEVTPEDEAIDIKPILLASSSPPQESSLSVVALSSSELLHINGGDSQVKELMMDSRMDSLASSSGTPSLPAVPSTSTSLSLNDLDLTQTFADENGQQFVLETPNAASTATITTIVGTPGTLSRLKRSFAEVDQQQRTNSAKRLSEGHKELKGISVVPRRKLVGNGPGQEDEDIARRESHRPIVPAAFISTYTPIHHSSHPLGTKWGSETTTTIIFDQHNNNG